ncbi:MAG TPA: VCBS repeat-containing protein [Labilithrix sp.]
MIRRLVPVFALLGLAACGPGAAYDNLSGGTTSATEDSALEAPRPMSPVAVSTVATSRPRFKWELFGTATGAIVELSKTRAFDGDIKRYAADGRELVVPEDIDPGIWFWRLTARTSSTYGTKTSPVWEVLVRGPAAHGASDSPTGSIADLDGDGIPDLLTVFDGIDGPDVYAPVLLPMRGTSDKQFTSLTEMAIYIGPDENDPQPIAIAAGTDADGDGISDLAYGFWVDDPQYGAYAYAGILQGVTDPTALIGQTEYPIQAALSTMVSIREAGDANGDGYGDYIVSDAWVPHVTLGSAKGPHAYIDLAPGFVGSPTGPTIPPYVIGAPFDADGDGVADVALGFPAPAALAHRAWLLETNATAYHPQAIGSGTGSLDDGSGDTGPQSPIFYAAGGADRLGSVVAPLRIANTDATIAQPIAIATGDFDGDGISDMASSMAIGRSRRVCVWFGRANDTPLPGPCVHDDGDVDLGTSMTAADIEGDGIDELIVSTQAQGGSMVVMRADRDLAIVAKVTNLGPTVLTTIWPGRPGPARWAALSADGRYIRVFEGTSELQKIERIQGTRGYGRALR